MRKKKDGSENPIYNTIIGYNSFISLAAADEPSQASKVTVRNGTLEENLWYDQTTKEVRSGFQISSNFINTARPTDEEGASFELSGVVGKMIEEVDKDGNETGRLKINFVVVGYNGKANVVDLIAADSAKSYIESNWETGDTVNVTGRINMTYSIQTYYEEQGFGEPIKRTRTNSKRELIVTGGSPNGLEESLSYDNDDVKAVLNERIARIEELKNNSKAVSNNSSKTNNGFTF